MAKVELSTPFEEIRGAFSKTDKIINRRILPPRHALPRTIGLLIYPILKAAD